ncbi:hypothetical protein EG68_11620 [Paragonimus skrjabini miyazakii]|uniref:Transmembrane protein 185B n=1 Tax=Paragonimus skrjabini miyazakii TaxID=59628 RepID=A0A8S9YLJ3_9TREM|nr:hypothetical protein EG68_11620 [Paragonimus skrjabini miyazakii]
MHTGTFLYYKQHIVSGFYITMYVHIYKRSLNPILFPGYKHLNRFELYISGHKDALEPHWSCRPTAKFIVSKTILCYRGIMSLQEKLENVNEGNVFVCFCLFWWIMLVGARADNLLIIPYWIVFLPLWLWKLTVFFGWLIGLVVWLRQRNTSVSPELAALLEDPALPHIQAMSVSMFFTLLLSCSEILLCLHLSVPSLQLAYLTILTPVLLVGLLGICGFFFVMIDSRSMFSWTRRRRGRYSHRSRPGMGQTNFEEYDPNFTQPRTRRTCSFTLELCIAANLLQLLFLVSRLDNWIRSKWIVTFIPTFILLGMGFLFCTVGFIVALIRYFTAFFIPVHQRRLPVYYYASHIFIDFLLCTSVIFLALRLDDYLSSTQVSYSLICAPVLLSLIIYAVNSLSLGPGNPWWFGLNRSLLLALFEACPTLQLCANTSVTSTGLWKCTSQNRSDITHLPGSHGEENGMSNSRIYSQDTVHVSLPLSEGTTTGQGSQSINLLFPTATVPESAVLRNSCDSTRVANAATLELEDPNKPLLLQQESHLGVPLNVVQSPTPSPTAVDDDVRLPD